jgi:hypothetical protein
VSAASHPSAFALLSVASQSESLHSLGGRHRIADGRRRDLRPRLCAASRRAPCQAAERASRTGARLGRSVRWHGVGDRGHAVGGKGRLIFLYSYSSSGRKVHVEHPTVMPAILPMRGADIKFITCRLAAVRMASPRPRCAVCQARPTGTCPRRASHCHRLVPRHGDDLLAAPGGESRCAATAHAVAERRT